jgi:hypothetical protein
MPKLVSLCLITGAATLAITACTPFDREAIRGSGEVTTRDYDVSDFDRIRVGRALDIEIVPGETHSLELTADDNIMRYITVDQRGDTLVLDVDDDVSLRRATHRFEVAVPELERLELHGAASAQLAGFFIDGDIELALSGASELEGTGIKVASLHLDLSGASEVRLEGTGDTADVRASGTSFVELRDLTVAEADVQLHGASKANVMATRRLDADLSGFSRLRYGGDPSLGRIETSGGSNLAPA